MSERGLARPRTESRVLGLFQMMKTVSAEGRRTKQILDGGGEAQRRERIEAEASQSQVLAAQATRNQGCQDVDSRRDRHVRASMTTGPGIQRVRFHKAQGRCTPSASPVQTGATADLFRRCRRCGSGNKSVSDAVFKRGGVSIG